VSSLLHSARAHGLGVLLLVPVACIAAGVAIDGSTDEAFEQSHAALLAALSPEQRLQFSLAEAAYISQFSCSTVSEPIPGEPSLTNVLGGMTSLKACRKELDGKTFGDIIAFAEAKRGRTKVR